MKRYVVCSLKGFARRVNTCDVPIITLCFLRSCVIYLRVSYNTYERVERLASKGFQESACDTSK